MNPAQYLKRIGIEEGEHPDHAFLAKLQLQHMLNIPFENLDVVHGIDVILDVGRIYRKVVMNHRGGFCYELNGLFHWLLEALGFPVSMVSAEVYRDSEHQHGPMFDHLVLLVELDKQYLVDVGFGDCFCTPIAMPDGEIEDVNAKYRLVPPEAKQGKYRLQKEVENDWHPVYRFSTEVREFSDFQARCAFIQGSPKSPFRRGGFCTIVTRSGRVTLTANNLTITENGVRRKIPVTSDEEHRGNLTRYFGIPDCALPSQAHAGGCR